MEERIKKSKIYYSKDCTPKGVADIFHAVGRHFDGRVFIRVDEMLEGLDIASELSTELDACVGYDAGEGEFAIPVGFYGHLQDRSFVSDKVAGADAVIIVSCFKRRDNKFGGALDGLSLGLASEGGRLWIKSAGYTKDPDVMSSHVENDYSVMESMTEAGKGVQSVLGRANLLYINLVYSVDGDQIGLIAGVDPVAVDWASFRVVNFEDKRLQASFVDQDDEAEFERLIDCAEEIGLGEKDYQLIEI